MGRWKLGQERADGGMAFTEDSRLFAKFNKQTMEYDRDKSMWKRALFQYPERGLLLGAERNDLVYAESGGLRLTWVRP